MATSFQPRGQPNIFMRSLNQKLEPPVRAHLKKVYNTLALATLAAAAGGYIHLFTNILSGNLTTVLGALGFGLALYMTPDNGKNESKRLSYLMGFAGCTGIVMGPMLEIAMHLNPSIIPKALITTCLVFGSFSLSSIFSNHSKWIYMGGALLSMTSLLLFTSLMNLFIGSYYLYQAQLLLGVILLSVFVMYDTAMIIEKRRMGDTDYILHSMLLFTDFIDLFQKFMTVLMQKERSNDRNRSNRR